MRLIAGQFFAFSKTNIRALRLVFLAVTLSYFVYVGVWFLWRGAVTIALAVYSIQFF
jgi:hypothetical protein